MSIRLLNSEGGKVYVRSLAPHARPDEEPKVVVLTAASGCHMVEGYARHNAFVHTHPCAVCGSYAAGERFPSPIWGEDVLVCEDCTQK